MKKSCLPLGIILMLLLFAMPVNATDFGKHWLGLPKWVRNWYVAGFCAGYFMSYVDSTMSYLEMESEHAPGEEFLARKKYQEKRDKAQREIPTRVLVVLSIEYGIIADLMTELYEDPANRGIGHRDICYIAINRLIGDTKEEMERALKQFRESTK